MFKQAQIPRAAFADPEDLNYDAKYLYSWQKDFKGAFKKKKRKSTIKLLENKIINKTPKFWSKNRQTEETNVKIQVV